MMSAFLVLYSLLIASKCSIIEEYDCNIFSNDFTVYQGEFQDVCGNITMYGIDTNKNRLTSSYLNDHINQNDNTFIVENGELIAFTPYVPFDGDEWAIMFEGYSKKSTKNGFNIILGPGGQSQNCQLRFENGNGICIYSYYRTPTYSQCISLPYDINQLHTLLLYYKTGTLSVYQNNVFVDSVQKNLHIAFSRIGGWYHTYYGDVAIKNIKFSKNAGLADIVSYNQYSTSSTTSTTLTTTTEKPSIITTTTVPNICDCQTNEEIVEISCITRSAQGDKWLTGRGDTFLEPNVLSKHFIADIINDNKKIYKYRLQWFSNSDWSTWYFPGVNDNEWTAKNDWDDVWNQAHKDAGRRSWTMFADHFHQVCYLMNETLSTASSTITPTSRVTREAVHSTEVQNVDTVKDSIEISDDEKMDENDYTEDAIFSKWTVIAFFGGVLFMLFLNIICFVAYIIMGHRKPKYAAEQVDTEEFEHVKDEGTTNT